MADRPASRNSMIVQVALLALAAPVLPYDHILHLDGAHVAQHLHLLIPDVLCVQTHLHKQHTCGVRKHGSKHVDKSLRLIIRRCYL